MEEGLDLGDGQNQEEDPEEGEGRQEKSGNVAKEQVLGQAVFHEVGHCADGDVEAAGAEH